MTLLIDIRIEGYELSKEMEETLKNVCLKCLQYEKFEEKCEISLSLVTIKEIKKINKQFRGIDKETDVLSFPQLSFDVWEEPEKNENDEIILGDIIISVDTAIEQAEEYGHSFMREMAFLTAHSMLHLLGYDHIEEDEEKVMVLKQKEILESLGILR